MKDNKAFWLWFAQRISAVIILAAISIHIYIIHYAKMGDPILFSGVALRLKDISWLCIDITLLFAGLFHGLNGVRMILLDFDLFDRYERAINWILILTGLFFFILGIRGLWAFFLIKS